MVRVCVHVFAVCGLTKNPFALFVVLGQDTTIRIWNTRTGRCEISLSGHTDSVEALRWGGVGLLYSGSRDRTIKVWASEGAETGKLVRTLSGHGHRINSLALSCEYVCRTGPFGHTGAKFKDPEVAMREAQSRYDSGGGGQTAEVERLVSGSDDFSLFLWRPSEGKQPVARMTGHVQAVNDIAFRSFPCFFF